MKLFGKLGHTKTGEMLAAIDITFWQPGISQKRYFSSGGKLKMHSIYN